MKRLNELSKSNKLIVVLILAIVVLMLVVSYNSLASNNDDFNDSGGWTLNIYNNSSDTPLISNNHVYVDYNNVMVNMFDALKYIGVAYGKTQYLNYNETENKDITKFKSTINAMSSYKFLEKYSPNITSKANKGVRPYDSGITFTSYDKMVFDLNNNKVYVPDRYNYYYDDTHYVAVDDSVYVDIEETDDGEYYLPLYFFTNIPGIEVKVDDQLVYNKGDYKTSFEAIDRTKTSHEISIRVTSLSANNNLNVANESGSYYGRDNGSLWREEALKRIEKYRKKELKVQVKDENGNPISGATISLRLKSNPFLFGTNLSYTKDADSGYNNYGVNGNTYTSSSTTFNSSSLLGQNGINKNLFNSAGVLNIFDINEGKDSSSKITEALRKDSINTLRSIGINNVRGSFIYDSSINNITQSILGDGTNTDISDNNITLSAVYNKNVSGEELDNLVTKVMNRYQKMYTDYIDYLMSDSLYKNVNSYDLFNNIGSLNIMYKLLYKREFLTTSNFFSPSVYNNISSTTEDYTQNEAFVNLLTNVIKRIKKTGGYTNEVVFSENSNKGTFVHDNTTTSVTDVTNNIIKLIKAIDNKYFEDSSENSSINTYAIKYKPTNYATPQSYMNELDKIVKETLIKNGKIVEYDNSNGISREEFLRDTLIMAYSDPSINEFNFYNYYDESKTSSLEKTVYSKFIQGEYFYDKKNLLTFDEDYTSDSNGLFKTRLYNGNYELVVTLQDTNQTFDIDLDSDQQFEAVFEVASLDLIKPVVSNFNVTENGYSSKVSFKCSDEVNVKGWYFGPKSNPTSGDFTTTDPFAKEYTIPDYTVNTEGVYYYGCLDSSNNISNIESVEFNKYVLNTNLLNKTGTKGTYNNTNYSQTSTHNYIVKKDTSVNISNNLGDVPTGSNASLYKGVTLNNSSTISSDNIVINNNTNVLNAYYDLIEYTITAVCVEGSAGVTMVNTSTNETVTSTTTNNNKSIIVRHGVSLSVTANINQGYTFSKWSGISESTNNPLTITPIQTGSITPVLEGVTNEKPTSSIENISNTLKADSVSFKIKCSDDTKVSKYYFGTALTPNDSDYVVVNDNSSAFEKNISKNESGTYYLSCVDNMGEKSVASMIKINKYTVNKMLLNENGNKDTHNTNNYTQVDTKNYLGVDSLVLTMSSLSSPLPDNAYSYLGYSLNNAGTSSVTLNSDNPTNSTANGIYTLWYDRISTTPSPSNPVAQLSSITNNVISKKQNVTLKCNSSENITKYYVGTSNNPSDSSYMSFTTPSNNALVKIDIQESGNYYFGCMSESGLKSTMVSQEYSSYTIKKELLNVTGSKGTYNNTNYKEVSSDSYIIPKGSSLNVSDINKSLPEGTSLSFYKGYSIGDASLSTDNPIINENKTITMWFDRTEYKVNLVATSLVPRIVASNENNDTVVVTLDDNNKQLISRYGEKVVVTATSSDGKAINWGNISNSSDDSIVLSPTGDITIKIESSSNQESEVINPKTGSITQYIKYVLLVSLVMLVILFKSFKGFKFK